MSQIHIQWKRMWKSVYHYMFVVCTLYKLNMEELIVAIFNSKKKTRGPIVSNYARTKEKFFL
jgi:hypothetical protein